MSIVLVMAVSNNLLVKYGAMSIYGAEIPMTTMGITMKVNQIMIAVVIGLATGAQPIFGFNYGSGQTDRVKKTLKITLIIAESVLICAFLLFQFAPMSVVSIFGSESQLYNEFAVKCMRTFLMLCCINGFQLVSGIFFHAALHTYIYNNTLRAKNQDIEGSLRRNFSYFMISVRNN